MPESNTEAIAAGGAATELAQARTGESIGQISAVEGAVLVTHPDGSKVTAATGTPIFQGDLVETKAAGPFPFISVNPIFTGFCVNIVVGAGRNL